MAVKYSMMVRSRPNLAQSIEEKHNSFISCLGTDGWGFEEGKYPPAPNPGYQLSAILQLRRYLKKGMKGRICYSIRLAGRDEAMYDDYCLIEFNPTTTDYSALVTRDFKHYIACFSAYIGAIMDIDCYELDFEKSRGIDGRHGVVRIAPVCFFDKELCLKSFGLTPEQIASRIAAVVEQVSLFQDGVLIIASSRVLTIEESNAIDEKIRSLLK